MEPGPHPAFSGRWLQPGPAPSQPRPGPTLTLWTLAGMSSWPCPWAVDCDHAGPSPGKPGQPSAGLPARASHPSLSWEPGFTLFLVIFQERALPRLHLEFSQLGPARGRTRGSRRDQEPRRPCQVACLGPPRGLRDRLGDLEQVWPLCRLVHLGGQGLVTSGVHSGSKMSPAGSPAVHVRVPRSQEQRTWGILDPPCSDAAPRPACLPPPQRGPTVSPPSEAEGSRAALLERGRHRQPAGEFTNLPMSRCVKKSGAVTHWSAFLASL